MSEAKRYALIFHFDNDQSTSVETDDPEGLYQEIAAADERFMEIEQKLINLDNVTYITVRDKEKRVKAFNM